MVPSVRAEACHDEEGRTPGRPLDRYLIEASEPSRTVRVFFKMGNDLTGNVSGRGPVTARRDRAINDK